MTWCYFNLLTYEIIALLEADFENLNPWAGGKNSHNERVNFRHVPDFSSAIDSPLLLLVLESNSCKGSWLSNDFNISKINLDWFCFTIDFFGACTEDSSLKRNDSSKIELRFKYLVSNSNWLHIEWDSMLMCWLSGICVMSFHSICIT